MSKRAAAGWCVLRVDMSRGTSSISKQNGRLLGGRGENHAVETGDVLSKCEWNRLLGQYYDLHGWNPVTGWPTHQRLVELGLDGYDWILDCRLRGTR